MLGLGGESRQAMKLSYTRGGGRACAYGRLNPAKLEHCPRCGAKPHDPCVRRPAGLVGGDDIGGGYFRAMKGFHAERYQ